VTVERPIPLDERLAVSEQGATLDLRPAIAKVKCVVAAKQYPDDVLEALVEIVEYAATKAREGLNLNEIAGELDSNQVTFEQPNWNASTVNNAQQIFQVIVDRQPKDETASIFAPVVLVAMTNEQAAELASGDAFTDDLPTELRASFTALSEALCAEGIEDWLERYGADAKAWHPFGGDIPSIQELVERTFATSNADQRYSPLIQPEILGIDEVRNDRRLLRRLREGCLVIVDSMSMRHPAVQRWFHRSLLDAYPTTAVLFLAPVHGALQVARQLAVYVMLRHDQLEFSRRLGDVDEDAGVCEETGDCAALELWLARRIRKLAPEMSEKRGVHKFMKVGA